MWDSIVRELLVDRLPAVRTNAKRLALAMVSDLCVSVSIGGLVHWRVMNSWRLKMTREMEVQAAS